MNIPAVKHPWAAKWGSLWVQGKYRELLELIESKVENIKANGNLCDFLAAQNDSYITTLKCFETQPFEKYAQKLSTYRFFLQSVAGMAVALPYSLHGAQVVLPIAHNLLWVAYINSFKKGLQSVIQQVLPTVAVCMKYVALSKGVRSCPALDQGALEKYIITTGVGVLLHLNDSDCVALSSLLVTLGMILCEKMMQSADASNERLREILLLLEQLSVIIEEESYEVNHYKLSPATNLPIFMLNSVNEASTNYDGWSRESRTEFKDFLLTAQILFSSVLSFTDPTKSEQAFEMSPNVSGPKYKCLAIYLAALNLHKMGKYDESLQTIIRFSQYESNAHDLLRFRACLLMGVNYYKTGHPLQAVTCFSNSMRITSSGAKMSTISAAYIALMKQNSTELLSLCLATKGLEENGSYEAQHNFVFAVMNRVLYPFFEVNPAIISYVKGRTLLEVRNAKDAKGHYARVFESLKAGEHVIPFYQKFVEPPFELPPIPFIYHEAIYCSYVANDLTEAKAIAEEALQRYVPYQSKSFTTIDDVVLSFKKDVITLWLLSLICRNTDFEFECITNALGPFCHLTAEHLKLVAKLKARLLWRRALWQESRGLMQDAVFTYSQALESYPVDKMIFEGYMKLLSTFDGFRKAFQSPSPDTKEVFMTKGLVIQGLLVSN